MRCCHELTQVEKDQFWMRHVQKLALKAQTQGEVPVGAALVVEDKLIAQAWNQSIGNHDPSAHAEILVLRKAGKKLANYRLIESTLYVSLEPCPMCAGAMVHARVKRLVFGAFDPKTGAAGSAFNMVQNAQLNHQLAVTAGVCETECSHQLSQFFKMRRQQHKLAKQKNV